MWLAHPPLRNPGSATANILIIFSEKPYDIKEFLVRRGEDAPGAPSQNPSLKSAYFHPVFAKLSWKLHKIETNCNKGKYGFQNWRDFD